MYFKDMTQYRYRDHKEKAFNIGWLSADKPMNTGEVPEAFIKKLWKYLRYPVQVCRGFHTCELCSQSNLDIPIVMYKHKKRKVGYYEIRVWGKDGNVYAAPSLIYHYVTEHGYKPPQEFIDAVMESEHPDSKEYYQKVLEYSKGDDFWLAKDRTRI